MNACQNYQSLVDQYQGGVCLVKKLGIAAMAIQGGIFGFVNGWKHLQIEYFNIAAPLLFSLSIFFLIKDFLPYRRIDGNMSRIVLEGFELEKMNSSFGNFFHDVLQNFNLPRTVLRRSWVDLAVLWLFGNWMYRFVVEISPDFSISRGLFNVFLGGLHLFLCKLYFSPFKDLVKVRAKVFAK